MRILIVFIAFAMTVLSGCATFEKNLNSERLLVQVGTMKVIEAGKGDADRSLRAARIVTIATEAKSWLNTESVTVDVLKSRVYARIDALNLQPSDRLLAGVLVDTVVDELQTRLVNGVKVPVPSDQVKYQVNTVLTWVIEAANSYVIAASVSPKVADRFASVYVSPTPMETLILVHSAVSI